MGKEFLKFGEAETEKQEFHSSKSAVTINNIHSPQKVPNTISVCNFQSMKSPVELNSLLSKFFCYITWFVKSPD